jgi:mannitol/fructose-specific phosphotransferase system IIA component (Ntr-type)
MDIFPNPEIKLSNISTLEHFWEYFSFVANSLVFLLLGLTEYHIFRNSATTTTFLEGILYVIPVVIVARVACVYILIPLFNKLYAKSRGEEISLGYQAILFWGGLRGAVPVALVLAIPMNFEHRDLIVQFTFIFILFTLLFQGTTIKILMDKLGIRPDSNDFGDRKIETEEFNFENSGLAILIMQGLKDMFDDEAYFIRDKSTEDGLVYLMKHGSIMFQIEQVEGVITLISEPENIPYFKRVLYESLLTLDHAVESIKTVVNPDKINNLIAREGEGDKSSFNLLPYIKYEQLLVNIQGNDKKEIITELVQQLVEVGSISKKHFEEVVAAVVEREDTMTTALGDGVAMPHARKCSCVEKMTVLVALAPSGIDFGAIDGKPVYIFVLILTPQHAAGPHVQLLAEMSKILAKKENRDEMLAASTPKELYATFEKVLRK